MRGEDRRELVLKAACRVFGDHGYDGTTTADVANAAGVSQPYVVRMFGTKEALFLDVLTMSLDSLLTAFRAALADDSDVPVMGRLGRAYIDLTSNRGLLLSLMHGFVLGRDPQIGAAARKGFLDVYRFLRHDAGFTADETHSFLAGGMLINTMIGIRMTDDYGDADVNDLLGSTFGDKLDVLLDLAKVESAEADQAGTTA
ncbi:TetR family transcriptional regulator [soil metagenome]